MGMIKACTYSREATTVLRHAFIMRRPTASRNIALMLLDTGMRASEVCSLAVGDVDLKTGKVEIKQGPQGGAKGSKGRTVYRGGHRGGRSGSISRTARMAASLTPRCSWREAAARPAGAHCG